MRREARAEPRPVALLPAARAAQLGARAHATHADCPRLAVPRTPSSPCAPIVRRSDDGGQRTSSAHQPSRRSRAPRQPRSKAPTAALAMPGSQTLGTLPHQPPRAAGAGLMAPPKPPGANVRSALPAAEPTICAKRRRAAGGPSAAHRLPFAAGPPTLAHAKLPLVTEPGVPPFAARRLPLAPPHSAAIGSLGGDGHADMLLDPYCAHPPVAAAPGSTS